MMDKLGSPLFRIRVLWCKQGDELSARGLGCDNDFVEARICAQIIPAGIEAEIPVCHLRFETSRNRRNFFELIESKVAFASPRVNQCQIGSHSRTVDCVLVNWQELSRAPCLTDRLFPSAQPSIKRCNLR